MYGDARWNLITRSFLLCNSEFLILVFSTAEVLLQVYSLRSSPDRFVAHSAPITRLVSLASFNISTHIAVACNLAVKIFSMDAVVEFLDQGAG